MFEHEHRKITTNSQSVLIPPFLQRVHGAVQLLQKTRNLYANIPISGTGMCKISTRSARARRSVGTTKYTRCLISLPWCAWTSQNQRQHNFQVPRWNRYKEIVHLQSWATEKLCLGLDVFSSVKTIHCPLKHHMDERDCVWWNINGWTNTIEFTMRGMSQQTSLPYTYQQVLVQHPGSTQVCPRLDPRDRRANPSSRWVEPELRGGKMKKTKEQWRFQQQQNKINFAIQPGIWGGKTTDVECDRDHRLSNTDSSSMSTWRSTLLEKQDN